MQPYQHLNRSIDGRVAIITGAGSGMGRATAHLFAREGAKVAITDLHEESCQTVAQEIKDAGYDNVAIWPLDVADADAINRVVGEVVAKWGGLDIIINNAGFGNRMPMDDPDYDVAWNKKLAVMLTAHQVMFRAALPHLRQSDAARVVNVASTEGLGATPGNSAYVAAKTGVIGLTRAQAAEYGREGITANCICPGPIHTGITAGIPDEHKEIYTKRRVPLRRYGIPEEVANITLSVVLPAASYLNGVAIPVDGGMLIKNA